MARRNRTEIASEQTVLLNSILEELRAQNSKPKDDPKDDPKDTPDPTDTPSEADTREKLRTEREERRKNRIDDAMGGAKSLVKGAYKSVSKAIGKSSPVGKAAEGLSLGGVALAGLTASAMQFVDGFNNLATDTFGEDASTQEKISAGVSKLSTSVANMLGFDPDSGELAVDINDALNETKEDLNKFTTGLRDAFKNFKDGKYIDSLASTLNEGTANLFSGVRDALKNVASKIKPGSLLEKGKNFFSNVGSKISSTVGGALGSAGTFAKGVASVGTNLMKNSASKIVSFAGGGLEKLGGFASNLTKGLGATASKALPFIGPLFEGYEAATTEYGSSKDIGKSLTKGVSAAIGAGAGGLGGAYIGGALGTLIFPGVGTAIGATIGSVVGQNLGGNVGAGIGGDIYNSDAVTGVRSEISNTVSGVKSNVNNLVENVNSQIDLRSQQLGQTMDYVGYKVRKEAQASLTYLQQFNSSSTNTTVGNTIRTNPGFTNSLDYVGGA